MAKLRIQKYLSQQGLLSRRQAEAFIEKGLIKVNGKIITEQGVSIDPEKDQVEITSKGQAIKNDVVAIAFHKPPNVITNCPQNGDTEIIDLLPKKLKSLHSIGRLDKDSEGLILLTNSGIFAKRLLTAAPPHKRTYEVWVNAPLKTHDKDRLEHGIFLMGKQTKSLTIECLTPTHFRLSMSEGRNRQIRKMMASCNLKVIRLKRLQFGPLKLHALPMGAWRYLSNKEISAFY